MLRLTGRTLRLCGVGVVASVLISISVSLAAPSGGSLASVGSTDPTLPFSQNKQNEPAIAIDAAHPDIVVAGANDNIDLESCNAGDPPTCPFTARVGNSGVYF